MTLPRAALAILLVFTLSPLVSCKKSTEPDRVSQFHSGLQGQVYANKGQLSRSPYRHVTVIQVIDATTLAAVKEVSSDTEGKFTIPLSAGSYFLSVKGFFGDETRTGPFEVQSTGLTQAEAFYHSASM